MFSSISHVFHLAFLLDSGAPLEVRGSLARVRIGEEMRSIEVGDMTSTDVRILCSRALRDAQAALSLDEWAALCARWGHGRTKAEGFARLTEKCGALVRADITPGAVALFKDQPTDSPGARLLAGMRAALVAHAVASLPTGFLAGHVAEAE